MNRISGQQLSVLPFPAVALKSLQRQQHSNYQVCTNGK